MAKDRDITGELRIRVRFGPDAILGPGKAELLEHIAATGSISAAGREMGMSYKRAWQLVETLNAMFRMPLVESTRGGARGGGAQVTPMGQEVLGCYRALEQEARDSGASQLERLQDLLCDMSDGK